MISVLILFIISFYISLVIYIIHGIVIEEYKGYVKCNHKDSCDNFKLSLKDGDCKNKCIETYKCSHWSWDNNSKNDIWCPYCPIYHREDCDTDKHEYIICKNRR